jgi:hypothetical protein
MPPLTFEQSRWLEYLHEASGLNRFIAEKTPRGTLGNPKLILEINSNTKREMSRALMEERHLEYWNLGTGTEGFDHVIQCDNLNTVDQGLEAPALQASLENRSIGTTVISHQIDVLSTKAFAEFFLSAGALLPEGGNIMMIDWIHRQNSEGRAQKALIDAKEALGNTIRVTRHLIAPLVSRAFALRIASQSNAHQFVSIRQALTQHEKYVKAEIIPLNLPIQHPFTSESSYEYKGDYAALFMADEMFLIERLTKERLQKLKEERRKERRKK